MINILITLTFINIAPLFLLMILELLKPFLPVSLIRLKSFLFNPIIHFIEISDSDLDKFMKKWYFKMFVIFKIFVKGFIFSTIGIILIFIYNMFIANNIRTYFKNSL